ncbi:acyltransferase family protein [Hyphomonas sp.]|uniref:acyltransferase family protein n=1 Tax=Hyphomonas sp. TaxID=87 RepID=UPI003565F2AD
MQQGRINWIDQAKGVCIVLIVAMYTTSSYGDLVQHDSWVTPIVAWSSPFLFPTFFVLAALFLNLSLFGSTKHFFDRKILHFAYFYLVWLLIQKAALDASLLVNDPATFIAEVLRALVKPTDSLLLVYMLIVFHAVTRCIRFLPARKVFIAAALTQIAFATGWIDTGWNVANMLGAWYVFFFAGFVAAPHVFEFAERVSGHTKDLWSVLLGWTVANAAFVVLGVSGLPVISLALGFAGTAAVMALGIQLGRTRWLSMIGYAGRHCLIIYLTFVIPMTVLQHGFAANGQIGNAGLACLVISLGAVVLTLVFYRLARETPLNVLYRRPRRLRLMNARNNGSASLLPPPPTGARNV